MLMVLLLVTHCVRGAVALRVLIGSAVCAWLLLCCVWLWRRPVREWLSALC